MEPDDAAAAFSAVTIEDDRVPGQLSIVTTEFTIPGAVPIVPASLPNPLLAPPLLAPPPLLHPKHAPLLPPPSSF